MDPLAMPGTMNALNAALALAMLDRVGIHGGEVVTAICRATVPGRAELVGTRDGVSVFVDYAHSPESIREFLSRAKKSISWSHHHGCGCWRRPRRK